MGHESVTEAKIQMLTSMKKRVKNPNARKLDKGAHYQYNYTVSGDEGFEFQLYVRQSKEIVDSYSCGLSWLMPSGEPLTLARYNGPSHCHENKLEGKKVCYNSHIHKATEKYIAANKKTEGFAEATKRFKTLNGALHCLVSDCNIDGITTTADAPSLFD